MSSGAADTHHAHLEGRVTGLERDLQNMTQAVSSLSDTVQAGFADTRRVLEDAEQRHYSRVNEIHARLDESQLKQAERGQWNPGLVLAAITCAILVAGIFVSFVHMSISPAHSDIEGIKKLMESQLREEHRRNILEHDWHATDQREKGEIFARLTIHHTTIEGIERKLHDLELNDKGP